MPEKNKTIFTLPSPNEMLFTRLFDAPPSLLFQVWTDPTHLAKWWGPSGFTTSDISMDLKPGGIWRLIMHGPDGTDYKNRQIFLEVEKPKRLVYKHVPEEGDEISHHQTTVTFDEAGGGKQTALAMRMLFPSQEERDRIIKKYGADKGGVQTLNRLGLELERIQTAPHPTYANGKICYIEIPAVDIDRSAAFYQTVFGWPTRKRGDGRLAFDDTVGQVSGTWVTGRKPLPDPGLLVYIMVDNAVATIDLIIASGGQITQPIGKDAPEITARFTDPAGNLFGIYQQPKQS